jgi:hypothetical protein
MGPDVSKQKTRSLLSAKGAKTYIPQRHTTGLTNRGHTGNMDWPHQPDMATGRLLHKSRVHYIQPTRRNSTVPSSSPPRPTRPHKHMHEQHPLLG